MDKKYIYTLLYITILNEISLLIKSFLLTIKKKHEQAIKKYLKIKDTPSIHEKKLWKKVKKYQKIFQYIPGVLCVCVGNSLAMNATHKDSDIDLFIITKKDRIWTSRIYLTLILTILGQRKTHKKHAGKFCLSFFITEKSMNLEPIAIKNDIYLAYWIKTLVPIVNKDECFEKFIKTNKFIYNSLYEGDKNSSLSSRRRKIDIKIRRSFLRFSSKINIRSGDFFEFLLKALFLPRTKKSFQKLGKPFGVIISDDILKFHDKDKRKQIRDAISS